LSFFYDRRDQPLRGVGACVVEGRLTGFFCGGVADMMRDFVAVVADFGVNGEPLALTRGFGVLVVLLLSFEPAAIAANDGDDVLRLPPLPAEARGLFVRGCLTLDSMPFSVQS
jgi:hypothetical protein